MIEHVFSIPQDRTNAVEKVVFDDKVHYLHMLFEKGQGLPEHFSNSTVYMTVLNGCLSIQLDDQDVHKYQATTLLKIPFKTKMNVRNEDNDTLELIVVKAPAPQV